MTDEELQALVEGGFEPYALAFLEVPEEAELEVIVDPAVVRGRLTIDDSDWARFNVTPVLRQGLIVAFHHLVDQRDQPPRATSLVFLRASDGASC